MGLRDLIHRLTAPKIVDPNDIGPDTGTEDTYVLSLADVLSRLDGDEDDTNNFNIQEELIG